MNILILGNGFDIAHGLKTRYKDFLNYCILQYNKVPTYKPTNVYYTNLWIRHFINIQNKIGENWIDLEQEIYNVLIHITTLPIITNKDCHRILSVSFNDSSFNFYNIRHYLNDPFGKEFPENGYVRCDQYNNLNYKIYFSTPRGVVTYLYEQLREFTKAFQEYLLNEVLSKLNDTNTLKYKLSLKTIGVNKGDKDVHVLSFNYTDTCKRLYDKKFNTYCDINIKPVYVHGEVSTSNECKLVLGTHGFEQYNGFISADFNVFKKHNQRHRYGTIEPYQDLLRKIRKSRSLPNFHIIGHSLDKTDQNILKHILLANNEAKINIYYHDEEAQERLMNKIDDIIGEEEVMAKVRFIYQHDPKRGILIQR